MIQNYGRWGGWSLTDYLPSWASGSGASTTPASSSSGSQSTGVMVDGKLVQPTVTLTPAASPAKTPAATAKAVVEGGTAAPDAGGAAGIPTWVWLVAGGLVVGAAAWKSR